MIFPEFNFPKIQSIQYENLFKYVYYMELKRKHVIHIGKAMMRIDYWWNIKIHRTHVKDQWYLCICTSTRSDKYIEELLCTKRKNMFVLVSVYQMQILWSGPGSRAASSAMFSRKIKAQLVVWVEQIPRIHGRRSDSDSPFPANGGILIGTLHSVDRLELI